MTKEKMTIHAALSELKVINTRIYSKISELTGCVANVNSNKMIQGKSIEQFKKDEAEKLQSIEDLIKRRNAIKKAVTQSNAVTIVKIADGEFTVAEAIAMKNDGIDCISSLWSKLSTSYVNAKNLCERYNRDIVDRADKYIEGMYGANDKRSAKDSDEIEKARKMFIENNSNTIVSGIKIEEKIESLGDYIDNFRAEVDAALSVSNAITEIEIEY